MEFKGTKGVWEVCKKNAFQTEINTSKSRVAEVKHYSSQIDKFLLEPSEEEGKANAQLISAAPELLEALKIYLNAGSKDQRREASIIAKKAIEKATKID